MSRSYKDIKSVKCVLLVVFLILLIFYEVSEIRIVQSKGTPQVKVEPYGSFAEVGETFTVNITVSDVENLYGIHLEIRWNASILRIVSVEVHLGVESYPDGVLHEPLYIVKNETLQKEGRYVLAGLSLANAPPFSGDGNILRVVFNVTGVGTCRIRIFETELADWPPPDRDPRVSRSIIHETIDGFFGRKVELNVFPCMAKVDSNFTLSGSVFPPEGDVEVKVFYRKIQEGEWRLLQEVQTNERGDYVLMWQPQESGEYEFKAAAVVQGSDETSSVVLVSVEPLEPSVLIYVAFALVVFVIVALMFAYRKKRKA